MTVSEKKAKRERAFFKLQNQLSVLSRTVVVKDRKVVKDLQELSAKLSLAA